MRAAAGKHPAVVRTLIDQGRICMHAPRVDSRRCSLPPGGRHRSARILVAAGAGIDEVSARDPDARRDLTGGACIRTTVRGRSGPENPLCFVPGKNPAPWLWRPPAAMRRSHCSC